MELLADLCAFEHFTWVSQICKTDLLSNKNANVGKVYGKGNQHNSANVLNTVTGKQLRFTKNIIIS